MMNCCLNGKVVRMAAFLFLIVAAFFAIDAGAVVKRNSKNTTKKETKAVENTFKTPDFAFPETVGNNADSELRKALAAGDDVTALKAAIQTVISRNLVSKENYKDGIALFEDLSEKLKAPYSQLAMLLEAQIYRGIYDATPWVFNNRSIPLTPEPENVMEWSRDIFSNKITGLVGNAFRSVEEAKEKPLTTISSIIVDGNDAERMGMTVYDFMTLKGCSLLEGFTGNGASVIPFGQGGAAGNKLNERSAASLMNAILDGNIAWHEAQHNMRLASAMSYFKSNNMPWRDRKEYVAQCVKRYIDTPYCGAFILESPDFIEEEEDVDGEYGGQSAVRQLELKNKALKKRYGLIESYLKRFPDCDNAKALKNRLTVLGAENISVNIPSRIYPGEKGKVAIEASNVFKFNILVVKLPVSYINKDIRFDMIRSVGKVVGVVPVNLTGEKPVQSVTDVEIGPLDGGVYVLVPSNDSTLKGMITGTAPKMSLSTFTVSRLVSFRTSDNTKAGERLYVVDGRNLNPVEGARVTLTTRSNKRKIERITGKDGFVQIPSGSYDILITKGNDRLANDIWSWGYGNNDSSTHISGKILTDLSIYHPGDTIGFMGVVYSSKAREMSQLPDAKVRMSLCDANYQEVDTLHLVSDRFGRVTGKFAIPESGLLGNYIVRMMSETGESREYASVSVEVADYKSPTFFVTMEGTEGSYKLGDIVKVKGKVSTYSGVPVAGANIKFDVTYVPLLMLNSYVNANYGGEAVSDENGVFSIELPTEGLRGTKYAFGGYELSVSATNPAGETQEAPAVFFSLGEAYSINASLPGKICADAGEKDYAVRVMDIVGQPVKRPVFYRISEYDDDAKVVRTGNFESPVFKFDFNALPSGRYKIKFSLDKDSKDAKYNQGAFSVVTVYRKDDRKPPYPTPMWTPEERIVVPSDAQSVKVKVGSSYPDSWVYMQMADCDKVIERKWLRVDGGMVEIDVPNPADNNRIELTFAGMHDFSQGFATVTVIPQVQTEKVKVTALSFRDRIAP